MKEKILNYIGQDGLLHILCCIVLVSVIDIVLPLWVAVLITAAVAAGKEFVLPVDPLLVKALKQVLGGLLKVAINVHDLEAALQSGGPAKLDELQQRFKDYIEKIARGKDPNKTRIVLE